MISSRLAETRIGMVLLAIMLCSFSPIERSCGVTYFLFENVLCQRFSVLIDLLVTVVEDLIGWGVQQSLQTLSVP